MKWSSNINAPYRLIFKMTLDALNIWRDIYMVFKRSLYPRQQLNTLLIEMAPGIFNVARP